MILADFLPLATRTKNETLAKDHPILETKQQLAAARGLLNIATREEQTALSGMRNRLKDKWDELRLDFLFQHEQLPPALREESDIISTIAASPKTSLSSVREIVDKLGFVITPYEYLNPASYEKESWEMKRSIEAFQEKLGKLMQIYVVCPIPYYSIEKHVASKEDLAIYAGSPCAQAFMAISMAIPMFRSMAHNIAQLRHEVRTEVTNIKIELQNMARRLDALHAQMERQRLAELQRQKELQELKQQRILAMEPMMLAIPRKVDITTGDSWALVGPCWGPDFEDIVVAAMGFKKIEGQKQKLTQDVNTLLGIEDRQPYVQRIGGYSSDFYRNSKVVRDEGGYRYAPDHLR